MADGNISYFTKQNAKQRPGTGGCGFHFWLPFISCVPGKSLSLSVLIYKMETISTAVSTKGSPRGLREIQAYSKTVSKGGTLFFLVLEL